MYRFLAMLCLFVRACRYSSKCRWRQGSAKRPWCLREQPRKLHEGFMKPPRSLRNHGGSTKASRALQDAVAAQPFSGCSGATIASWSLRGAVADPSRSLCGAFTNSTSPRCNPCSLKGVFIVNPRSPRRKHVVSIFGAGLVLR